MTFLKFFSGSKLDATLIPSKPDWYNDWQRHLSNFQPSELVLNQDEPRRYASVEHAFQAAKYLNYAIPRDRAREIAREFEVGGPLVTARDAKKAGGKKGMKTYQVSLDIEGWGKNGDAVMKEILYARYDADAKFREILKVMIEENIHLVHYERSGAKESYWGAKIVDNKVVGKNRLGELMMEIAIEKNG